MCSHTHTRVPNWLRYSQGRMAKFYFYRQNVHRRAKSQKPLGKTKQHQQGHPEGAQQTQHKNKRVRSNLNDLDCQTVR